LILYTCVYFIMARQL